MQYKVGKAILGKYMSTGPEPVRKAIGFAEHVLGSSHGFLEQIARVESDYGRHPGTFDGFGGCGIWQIDPIGLLDTKNVEAHPNLIRHHNRIEEYLGISWDAITCYGLRYPLLGALAARLYLLNIPDAIPETLEERASYWKAYYNTNSGAGTVDDFIRENT
jgi:hypothetical protein